MCDGYGYNKMLIQIQGTDYNVNIPNSTPQVLQPKDNVKVRIYIYAGTSINNAIIRPKIEKGTVATSYSEFGQGSVGIKKINKNIMPINTEFYELTSNGIKNKSNSVTNKITEFKIKKGQKVEIALKLKTKTSTSTSFTFHTNGVGNTELGFININDYNLNQIYKKTYIATENTVIDCALWGNEKKEIFEFQFWAEINNITEYTEHQEETKILPIQKPMLIRDYFDKLNNKEVHTWKKIVLDGVNNKVTQTTTNQSGKYRYQYIDKDLKDCSLSEEKAYCTHLPLIGKSKTYDKILGFTVANNSIYIYTDGDTAVNFNAKLQNENYIFYIPVIESAYQKLDLTPEQTKVLNELDNFQTYKPVTNITTDSIAKLKLKYIADTKTYIDNKTSNLEQQVSVISELLSTTKTSSILLDNLQSDIESEVL